MSDEQRGLRLEWWEPDKLEPNPKNWRRHPGQQVESYRGIKDEVGWAGALLYNEATGRLVDGHLRRDEALTDGERVPVLVGSWTEGQEDLILGALDPMAAMADADEHKLGELLQEIEAESGRVLAALAAGGEAALREILAKQSAQEKQDPGSQLKRAEELQEKWKVEEGQLWKIGDHFLICGDSTDDVILSRLLADESPSLGLTSPPYWVGKEYEKTTTFEAHLELLKRMYAIAWQVIDDTGFFFVNFGDIAPQSITKGLTGVDGQCIYLMAADHYRIGRSAKWALYAARVWLKPFNRLQRPFWTYKTSIPHHQEYEHLWTWAKEATDPVIGELDDWAYAWTWRKAGQKKDKRFDWGISSRAVWDTRQEALDDKPLTRHVAAFPVGIPERALRAHSEPNAVVWEPFCGSGTTIVACEKWLRRCRAAELSPIYCAATLERLELMGLYPELVES